MTLIAVEAGIAFVYCRNDYELDRSNDHAIMLQTCYNIIHTRWNGKRTSPGRVRKEGRSAEKKKRQDCLFMTL